MNCPKDVQLLPLPAKSCCSLVIKPARSVNVLIEVLGASPVTVD